MTTSPSVTTLSVQVVGGSTAVLEIAGLRLIIDPTFDPPGDADSGGPRRTKPPGLNAGDVGALDIALVSHDQHPDNLDTPGRALLATIPLVLTTALGAERLGGTSRGLAPYERIGVDRRDGGRLQIMALPAQHGPVGAEAQSGPVIGFLLSGDGLPSVYVSGDNASVEVVREIVDRVGTVDVAVLFAGAARVPHLWDGAFLTLTSPDAAVAARVLGARAVIPVHCDGWTHYSQSSTDLAAAFAAAGLADVLVLLPAGESTTL